MKKLSALVSRFVAMLRVRKFRVITCLSVLVVGLVIATLVTPFRQTSDMRVFYDEATTSVEMAYLRAEVQSFDDETVTVKLLDGPRSGDYESLDWDAVMVQRESVSVGTKVIVGDSDETVMLIDSFRVPALVMMGTLFTVLVLSVGGMRGGTSLIGLMIGILVIGWMIVPLILQGHDAFWVCVAGSYIIAATASIVAHGFRRRTLISLVCIAVILAIVCAMSELATLLASLTGIYDEATLYLDREVGSLDMRGIIAGGIIIATLGVLDDIVTAQVAVVEELKNANPKMQQKELYAAGASVGYEHIASLVNTLALAYAGASLPFLLYLANGYSSESTVVLFNSEYLAVEIVRTLIASAGLVLAVPISTLTASYIYHRLVK